MKIKHPVYFGQLLHKRGFKDWFLYLFRQIEGRKFIIEPIHQDLFQLFQDIYDLKTTRDNINVPPRSAKTTLAKYFIAYTLAMNAKANFIYTSFSQELLSTISRELASILTNPVYLAMYNQPIEEEKEESNPINEFWQEYLQKTEGKSHFTSRKITTKENGVTLFASIGSTITGLGSGTRGATTFSGCLIVDDANKPSDIHSQTMRNRVKTYFEETLLSRLNESNTPIINIQQRLHLQDLSGFLIETYKFKTLKKPLIVDGVCQIPSQYTKERIEELQKNEYMFSAQYQQAPIMAGGNLFKKETIKEISKEELPSNYEYRFITGDLSYKSKEQNDYTCFCYWGVEVINSLPKLYLIDAKRKKINAVDVDEWIDSWIASKITTGFRYICIEDKSHGIYLNQKYRKKGYPVPSEEKLKELLPARNIDKIARANNSIPCLNSNDPNLIINKDIENWQEMKDELLSFPNADHDDFVDNVIDGVHIALLKRKATFFDIL